MPLGIAYMKAVIDRDIPATEAQSRLFVYPDRLLDAILHDPPDVLMVSNYVWNEALSLWFGQTAKRVKPDTLVVMGGPNISLEPERQIAWFDNRREIDAYVLGESDFFAAEHVKLFLEAGLSKARFGRMTIPSSLYRDGDGNTVRNETWARHKQIDEISSAWPTRYSRRVLRRQASARCSATKDGPRLSM